MLLALSSSPLWASTAWTPVDESDGVKIYKREVASSSLFEFRGVGVVEASIPRIVAFLADAPQLPRWVEGCSKGELIAKNFSYDDPGDLATTEYYEIAYGVNHAPWPLQDRDYVLKSSVKWVPASAAEPFHVAVTSRSVIDGRVPEQAGLTRITLMNVTIKLTPIGVDAKSTEVDFAVVMDPAGVIPHAIINVLTRSLPLKTITKLAELVQTDGFNKKLAALVQRQYDRAINTAAPLAH